MGKHGVTGIQGKWEQEQERKAATGTWKNHCYLLDSLRDSLPVKVTQTTV